jgi:hypothetical protein
MPYKEIYPERLFLQTPAGFSRALNEVAARRHQTRSELIRRALLKEIERAGVSLKSEQVARHS